MLWARAAQVFDADMLEYPENGRTLYRLTASRSAQGKSEAAATASARFQAAREHAGTARDRRHPTW